MYQRGELILHTGARQLEGKWLWEIIKRPAKEDREAEIVADGVADTRDKALDAIGKALEEILTSEGLPRSHR